MSTMQKKDGTMTDFPITHHLVDYDKQDENLS